MRFKVETPAAADVAFAEIADFANLEKWDPFVRRSWLDRGDPLDEGAVYVLEATVGLRLEYRIIDIEQPIYVVYQGGTERVRSTDTIEVEEHPDGSLITISSELRFDGPIKILGPLINVLVWLGGRLLSVPAMRRHLRREGWGPGEPAP